jgi:hypothetical protein
MNCLLLQSETKYNQLKIQFDSKLMNMQMDCENRLNGMLQHVVLLTPKKKEEKVVVVEEEEEEGEEEEEEEEWDANLTESEEDEDDDDEWVPSPVRRRLKREEEKKLKKLKKEEEKERKKKQKMEEAKQEAIKNETAATKNQNHTKMEQSPEDKRRNEQWKAVIKSVEKKLQNDKRNSVGTFKNKNIVTKGLGKAKPIRNPPSVPLPTASKEQQQPPKAPSIQKNIQASLLELKKEMEKQMLGSSSSGCSSNKVRNDVFSRQGKLKSSFSSSNIHKDKVNSTSNGRKMLNKKRFGTSFSSSSSSRKAFTTLSSNNATASTLQPPQKVTTTSTSNAVVAKPSRMELLEEYRREHKKKKTKQRLIVHAGGITKKDKYSDIHRARQQMVAMVTNKENHR